MSLCVRTNTQDQKRLFSGFLLKITTTSKQGKSMATVHITPEEARELYEKSQNIYQHDNTSIWFDTEDGHYVFIQGNSTPMRITKKKIGDGGVGSDIMENSRKAPYDYDPSIHTIKHNGIVFKEAERLQCLT